MRSETGSEAGNPASFTGLSAPYRTPPPVAASQ